MKTIAILLLVAGTAQAQFCAPRVVRSVRTVRKVQPSYVRQVKNYDVLFLVAPPGYYGAPAYSPPQQLTQEEDDTQKEILSTLTKVVSGLSRLEQRIDTEMDDVHRRLEDLEQSRGGFGGPPPVPEPPVPLVLQQQCGMCHGGGEEKGGFRLSDLANPRTRDLARAMIANNRMPVDADGHPVQVSRQVQTQLLAALEEMR